MFQVKRYTPEHVTQWDSFCKTAANSTFLHERAYMDYHSDRFKDHSLMVYAGDKFVALLPASEHGSEIRSHGGLTYGGLIVQPKFGQANNLAVFEEITKYFKNFGFQRILYKSVPHIYHRHLTEDDAYSLFRLKAECFRVDASTTIELQNSLAVSSLRKRGAKKAIKAGCAVKISDDFEAYFQVLAERLSDKYDAVPTHTAKEMANLQSQFPENIKLFATFMNEEMIAGTIVYDCGACVHTQYLASSPKGFEIGGLDVAILEAINYYKDRKYFDFGISTEQNGQHLNEGLKQQKEMFGGQTVVYSHYSLTF